MRWRSPADGTAQAGEMLAPIDPCGLSRPIGGYGKTSANRLSQDRFFKSLARSRSASRLAFGHREIVRACFTELPQAAQSAEEVGDCLS